jgi:ribosomal protein S4|tara:strand:+ start:9377 stop:10129 length:753 start_codon:yes stop_codon:yes gene_type:complete
MNQFKIHKQSRNKPRQKISYQVGVNVWGNRKLKKFYRKKWWKIRANMAPKNKGSVRALFGERLKTRQALSQLYGNLTKRQFKALFNQSEHGVSRTKKSFKGLLDRRFDAFLLRIGFARTIFKARQDILHGFFKVNGEVVTSPSMSLEVGDFVSPTGKIWSSVFNAFHSRMALRIDRIKKLNKRPKKKNKKYNKQKTQKSFAKQSLRFPVPLPRSIEFDYRTLTAIIIDEAHQDEIPYKGHVNFKMVRETF